MSLGDYKSSVSSLHPIAIRLDQKNVNAPDHSTYGTVTCDVCGEKFAIGPNRIFGARFTEAETVAHFEALLAADHQHGQEHKDSYELPDW